MHLINRINHVTCIRRTPGIHLGVSRKLVNLPMISKDAQSNHHLPESQARKAAASWGCVDPSVSAQSYQEMLQEMLPYTMLCQPSESGVRLAFNNCWECCHSSPQMT